MIEHAERPTKNINVVHDLVRQLTNTPEDVKTALILSDWCNEHGFASAAEKLKTGRNQGPGYLPILAALRALFGDPNESGGETGRYSAVFGLPRTEIIPLQVVTIVAQSDCVCRIQRVVIPDSIAQHLMIHELRAGNRHLLMNSEPIPGVLFGERMPDLLWQTVSPQDRVSLTIENNCNADISFSGAVLGASSDSPDIQRRQQWENQIGILESRLDEVLSREAEMESRYEMLKSVIKSQEGQLSLLRELVSAKR